MVEVMRYKSEGRGFDSRWCHWNFSSTQSFRPHYEYQEYFLGGKDGRCVRLTLPPSCADRLEIWEPQPPEPSWPVLACNGTALSFYPKKYWNKEVANSRYSYCLLPVWSTLCLFMIQDTQNGSRFRASLNRASLMNKFIDDRSNFSLTERTNQLSQ